MLVSHGDQIVPTRILQQIDITNRTVPTVRRIFYRNRLRQISSESLHFALNLIFFSYCYQYLTYIWYSNLFPLTVGTVSYIIYRNYQAISCKVHSQTVLPVDDMHIEMKSIDYRETETKFQSLMCAKIKKNRRKCFKPTRAYQGVNCTKCPPNSPYACCFSYNTATSYDACHYSSANYALHGTHELKFITTYMHSCISYCGTPEIPLCTMYTSRCLELVLTNLPMLCLKILFPSYILLMLYYNNFCSANVHD